MIVQQMFILYANYHQFIAFVVGSVQLTINTVTILFNVFVFNQIHSGKYEMEREKLMEKLNQAKYFSVLSDAATDSDTLENELVYVCFVAKEGPVNINLNIQDIEHARAAGVFTLFWKSRWARPSAYSHFWFRYFLLYNGGKRESLKQALVLIYG